jgi:hypothetical protein
MINYIDIEKLGFKKEVCNDTVYENEYGRPYWFMYYDTEVLTMGKTNKIHFTWSCDNRDVTVYKNETKIKVFNELKEFIEFFNFFDI